MRNNLYNSFFSLNGPDSTSAPGIVNAINLLIGYSQRIVKIRPVIRSDWDSNQWVFKII